ncbi:hypothetical protein KDRO_C06360 [Kluyveromyces lactis]|nr:hypothetical protein KDRO_C06360 [Kluyveromyces lactis]
MPKKFSSIADAVKYINDELTKKGYLKDNKLQFGASNEPSSEKEQLDRDKLVVNVINKLLQRVDNLQDRLKDQDLQLRKAQDKLIERTHFIKSEQNKAANTLEKERRVTKITKIQYREKDTKYLEAKIRKLQLELEDQSSQLRQYADGNRPNITWGTSLGYLTVGKLVYLRDAIEANQIDMLSDKLSHVIDINTSLSQDLDAATKLISNMNKTIYTKFVLQIPGTRGSTNTVDKSDHHEASSQALNELARDWEDIKSQLP